MGNVTKIAANGFTWAENLSYFNVDFTENYNEDSNIGYFFAVYSQYTEKLLDLHNDLPFLPERMKIEKVGKLGANLDNQNKQTLNHGLVFKTCIESLNSIKSLAKIVH